MEAVMQQYYSQDQPISPYKSQIRTPKKGLNRTFTSLRPSQNFGGLIQPPPPLPPYLSRSHPPFSFQQQPPLLPLPNSKPRNINTISRVKSLSCPPNNRKTNTPRKSKPQATSPKKEENLKPVPISEGVFGTSGGNGLSFKLKSKPLEPETKISNSNFIQFQPSAKRLGPDPKDLPKNVPKMLALSFSGTSNTNNVNTNRFSSSLEGAMKDQDEFSGSVAYTISPPPPSSLPLPTFSLRPKLSCNTQAAAGIDTGATDNLRRLLRLP